MEEPQWVRLRFTALGIFILMLLHSAWDGLSEEEPDLADELRRAAARMVLHRDNVSWTIIVQSGERVERIDPETGRPRLSREYTQRLRASAYVAVLTGFDLVLLGREELSTDARRWLINTFGGGLTGGAATLNLSEPIVTATLRMTDFDCSDAYPSATDDSGTVADGVPFTSRTIALHAGPGSKVSMKIFATGPDKGWCDAALTQCGVYFVALPERALREKQRYAAHFNHTLVSASSVKTLEILWPLIGQEPGRKRGLLHPFAAFIPIIFIRASHDVVDTFFSVIRSVAKTLLSSRVGTMAIYGLDTVIDVLHQPVVPSQAPPRSTTAATASLPEASAVPAS